MSAQRGFAVGEWLCQGGSKHPATLASDDVSCTRFRRHQVRCFMEREVRHGEKAVYTGVQAWGGSTDQGARRLVCAGVKRSWGSSDAIAQLGEAACGRSAARVPRPRPDEA